MSIYRRNPDEELRRLERNAESIEGIAKLLAAKLRVGQLLPEQVRVAACLRYLPALILYPEDIGGVGDGPEPRLDAEGMSVWCAGAYQLGKDIQQLIDHLPLQQIANIVLTIVTRVLDDIEIEYGDTDLPGSHFYIEVANLIQEAWEVIDSYVDETWNPDADDFLNNIRVRAAIIGNTYVHQNNLLNTPSQKLLSAYDAALRTAFFFLEVLTEEDSDMAQQYRENIGVHGFLREVCRLNPELINFTEISRAVLGMNS